MYISSDTNIWFDFMDAGCLQYPFLKKDFNYHLSDITAHKEFSSSDITKLFNKDIKIISLSPTEVNLVIELGKYKALSVQDRAALAIAKNRKWILLTGDGELMRRATSEHVEVHGSIWLLDKIYEDELISPEEYYDLLSRWVKLTRDGLRRLPEKELLDRLSKQR